MRLQNISRRTAYRYVLVGATGFGVDKLLLFLLTEHGHIYYLISSVIATGVGAAVNYILHSVWTYRKEGTHPV